MMGLLASFIASALMARAGDEATYVGSSKCKPCHFKQANSWAQTKMAKALDVLAPGVNAEAKTKAGLDPKKDYSKDPKCLKCHTTGYGKTGGFTTIEATPAMVGVGCEMCHGPGSKYIEIMRANKLYKKAEVAAAGLVSPPTKEHCLHCHNPESPFVGKDYVFDFEKRKAQGTHEHFPLANAH